MGIKRVGPYGKSAKGGERKAVAAATAVQGAFGAVIFMTAGRQSRMEHDYFPLIWQQ
jgi:hypothetical protein